MEDDDVLEDAQSSRVQVCVRVKPLTAEEEALGRGRCAVVVKNSVMLTGGQDSKLFTFDAVADEASGQGDIFAMVGRSIADSCVAGYNGNIFAYGQTGSGKTHTIQGAMTRGGQFLPHMKGLVPRVLDRVYFLMAQSEEVSRGSVSFECSCSFLEIYQDKIVDLLNPTTLDLSIHEDIKRGTYVKNLTERAVYSSAEALELLRIGAANRSVATTRCNKFSSRSHSVFAIAIQSKEEKNGVMRIRCSRLNLIDLAGSERQKLAQTKGKQLKEAGHTNKSLALLGNVIRALAEKADGKRRHVPYRDSKLTFLLKDSLGGNSRTTIIATISPLDTAFTETLSTLKFAQRAKLIPNKPVVNQDPDGASNCARIAQLQGTLEQLREQLAIEKACNQAALLDQLMSYETIVDERRRLRESNARLKEECTSKDEFVRRAWALVRLRDTNKSLQRTPPRTGYSENEALRQDNQHLMAMVENHPGLLKHIRESHNRELKLQEYKRLFGDNMKVYWAEIGEAQYLAKELSIYLERVKSGKATYETLLASPIASTSKKRRRVSQGDTTSAAATEALENWSLQVSKLRRTEESSNAARPSEEAAPDAAAYRSPDARQTIALFNPEYEEEPSWGIEGSTTTHDGVYHHRYHRHHEAEEGTTVGLSKYERLRSLPNRNFLTVEDSTATSSRSSSLSSGTMGGSDQEEFGDWSEIHRASAIEDDCYDSLNRRGRNGTRDQGRLLRANAAAQF